MAADLPDDLALLAATFLTQALSLDDDPSAIADELTQLERDDNTAVFAIRLDSSVGPAAFLIYAYDADQKNYDGVTGRERFDADIRTLDEARRHDAPGPRLIANGEIRDWIFLLATDPATFRALTGATDQPTVEATIANLPPTANTAEIRRQAAAELLRLLREAETQAGTWLAAVQAEAPGQTPDEPDLSKLAFDDVETELALFLLSGEGVARLLRTMNLFITAAKQRAESARASAKPTNSSNQSTPKPE